MASKILSMRVELHPIDCIITEGLTSLEKKFLSSYLEWRGFKPETMGKHSLSSQPILPSSNPMEITKKVAIWNEPNPNRIRDLVDKGLEILGVGRLGSQSRYLWSREGIARLWTDIEAMANMPVYFLEPHPKSLVVWIYTGTTWMDKILRDYFTTMGHRTILPLDVFHLFEAIPRERPDLVILDWDSIFESAPSFFSNLEKYSNNNSIPIILGIKDFNRANISTDLTRKISKFSKISLPRSKFFSTLLFGMTTIQESKPDTREVQRLHIDRIVRGNVKSVELDWVKYPTIGHRIQDFHLTWKWFEWLLDPAIFQESVDTSIP